MSDPARSEAATVLHCDTIVVEVTSGTNAAREALAKVLAGLTPVGLDVEESSTVELVLAEIMNNIVEHAYPAGDKAGPIRLTCHQQPDGLHFRIQDSGRMMPNGQAPLGLIQSYDVETDDLPEGGFGWFLIQDLAKDVVYQRVGVENHLSLRIAVGIPHLS